MNNMQIGDQVQILHKAYPSQFTVTVVGVFEDGFHYTRTGHDDVCVSAYRHVMKNITAVEREILEDIDEMLNI